MAVKFDGASRPEMQSFGPDALDTIVLGKNLRMEMDDQYIEELAHNIATQGQILPGIVRRDHEGRPVLVAGFCRFEAVRRIKLNPKRYGAAAAVPYLAVYRRMNEDDALALNLDENLQRRDLSPMDLAHAAVELERLGWERARIAVAMKCTAAHVGNLLSLVELPGKVAMMVHRGELPVSAALAMRKLPRERVDALAEQVERGEAKPQAVIQEAKDKKRAAGKKLSRSIAEVKALLEDLGTAPATDFLAWIDGEVTITDEVVRGIFADREHKAA